MDPTSVKFFTAFTVPALAGYALAVIVRFLSAPKRKAAMDNIARGFVVLMALTLAGLIVYGFISNFILALQILGTLVGVIVVCVGLIFGLSFLGDFLKHRHAASVKKRTTVVERERYGYVDQVEVVEPSKTAKFFMAIGDFLNLAFQVVRVKKWKICPIVEIPQQ